MAAIPVPVPETEAPREQTLMDQRELARFEGSTERRSGPPVLSEAPQDEVLNQPNIPPLVDELPEPIRRVEPRYPDIAQQAQIEGLVLVNVLVSKDGRVREVQLHPTIHVPVLDPAALEAARQWTFEPALMEGRPVAVWVALPFRFRLR